MNDELFSLFRVANRTFAATKGQMSNKNIETMNQNEEDFEQQVRAHKATIYTVCYMFSKNQDEVADFYQEIDWVKQVPVAAFPR